jgi:modulator of FtsH protease
VDSGWADFYVTVGGASAALTGLLFVAVALRPREIRTSPVMAGRARAAFYAFASALFTSLLALVGTSSRLIGLAQIGVSVVAVVISSRFTRRAWRTRSMNIRRAVVYHAGLMFVAIAGGFRAVQGVTPHYDVLLAIGVLLLLGIAISNSWQLVLTHDEEPRREG